MRQRTFRLFALLAGTFVLLLITGASALGAVQIPSQQDSPPDSPPDNNAPLTQHDLENFWHEMYPDAEMVSLGDESNVYQHELLAKAEPDECYNGIGVPIAITDTVPDCLDGQPKVNEAYIWGMTDYAETIWFGTAPNVHCLVMGGFLGSTTPIETDSYACEFGEGPYAPPLPDAIGDWRPPSLYRYDNENGDLTNVTPTGLARLAISNTLGIRSAATFGDYVFFAGPAFTPTNSINVFLYNAATQTYLGSRNITGYGNIRKWLAVDGVLYTAVGTADAGAVLRYTGNPTGATAADRIQFEEVGTLDADGAELALHEGRLFVNTWPTSLAMTDVVAGLWMSPILPVDGLTTADAGSWEQVFSYDEYEPDPLIARTYGGGALSSYQGDLFWGTMHVPFVATLAHLNFYGSLYDGGSPDEADILAAAVGSQRSVTIFQGRNFGTPDEEVEVAYGMPELPYFDPISVTWGITSTLLGPPKYGLSGFGNPFNNYTWSMSEYDGQLFVGTMDWSYLLTDIFDTLLSEVELPLDLEISLPSVIQGADLYRFYATDQPAITESINGVGNDSSYGVRNLLGREDGLYLGMANPMNLLTDLTDNKPEGGWELIRLTRHLIPLTVDFGSKGSGSVVSEPAGVACDALCSAEFDYGMTIVLTPTADVGSTFTGWTGDCYAPEICTIDHLFDSSTITANFTLDIHTLGVALAGDGSGSVLSEPAGINCGTDCDQEFNYGTLITLTATAEAGSLFTGWDGACSGTTACAVTLTESANVTATFANNTFPLVVTLAGDGSGSVLSNPAGINCGTACDDEFVGGTVVTLTATADAGSLFTGWDGACSGTTDCAVTIDDSNHVTATFSNNTFPLVVTLDGDGNGSVVSNPAGITCGTECDHAYTGDTVVTLTATPADGSLFTGWDGACSGAAACVVTIDTSNEVTATFANNRYPLVVNIVGSGSGHVASLPAGIACSQPTCSADFDKDTSVALSAIAFSGSSFESWSGGCSGTNSCDVTIGAGTTVVTATFSQNPQQADIDVDGLPLPGKGLTLTATLNMNPVTECTWDFGDGESEACDLGGASEVVASGVDAVHDVTIQTTHAYTQTGVYLVMVTASNDAGSVIAVQQITIQPPTAEAPNAQPIGPGELFFPYLNR